MYSFDGARFVLGANTSEEEDGWWPTVRRGHHSLDEDELEGLAASSAYLYLCTAMGALSEWTPGISPSITATLKKTASDLRLASDYFDRADIQACTKVYLDEAASLSERIDSFCKLLDENSCLNPERRGELDRMQSKLRVLLEARTIAGSEQSDEVHAPNTTVPTRPHLTGLSESGGPRTVVTSKFREEF